MFYLPRLFYILVSALVKVILMCRDCRHDQRLNKSFIVSFILVEGKHAVSGFSRKQDVHTITIYICIEDQKFNDISGLGMQVV